jgi:SH3-like domain-containing protein
MLHARVIIAALMLTSASAAPAIAQETGTRVEISHFTGKPVPRFESLRYGAVNGRAGPSRDHRVLWRYERAGLPVLILKESRNWRRVRDPDGAEVWVHARTLSAQSRAMTRDSAVLRRKPGAEHQPVARLSRGVVLDLDRCEAGWCRVRAHGRSGWLARTDIWGATAREDQL